MLFIVYLIDDYVNKLSAHSIFSIAFIALGLEHFFTIRTT